MTKQNYKLIKRTLKQGRKIGDGVHLRALQQVWSDETLAKINETIGGK